MEIQNEKFLHTSRFKLLVLRPSQMNCKYFENEMSTNFKSCYNNEKFSLILKTIFTVNFEWGRAREHHKKK